MQRGNAPSVFSETGYPALASTGANYYDAIDTPIQYADYALFKGCHLTPTMIAVLSSAGRPLNYPYVEMSGDIANGRPVSDPIMVIGRCDAEKFIWANNQQMGQLSFSLIEANLTPIS